MIRTTKTAAALWAFTFVCSAQAAVINVNTENDELNSDGDCSLREAVRAANTDRFVDQCKPGNGGDTIVLPKGEYTLSVTGAENGDGRVNDLDLTGKTTIEAKDSSASPKQTRIRPAPGFASDSAFTVAPQASATFRNLTIRGFTNDAGAAIYAEGSVEVVRATFRGNRATSSIGGGAIFADRPNETTTLVEQSVFIDNSATTANENSRGGAIAVGAAANAQVLDGTEAAIRDTTFVRNSTDGEGGAIAVASRAPTIDNVTITNNTAAQDAGGLKIANGNGNAVRVRNTIIARNRTSSASVDCVIGSERKSAAATDFNLIGIPDGCGQLVGPNSRTKVTPRLATAASYTGVMTSRPPFTISPAVDAGSCTDTSGADISGSTDQRGGSFGRNVDGDGDGERACDIGAIERQAPAIIVDSNADSGVDVQPGDGVCADVNSECTLRAAIEEANADKGLDEIVLPGRTITLAIPGRADDANTSGDLDIRTPLVVRGRGPERTSLEGSTIDRVFHQLSQRPLSLRSLSISGGDAGNAGGGAIKSEGGGVNLTDVAVSANTSGGNGGAILSEGGAVRVIRSLLQGNTSGAFGGALHVADGQGASRPLLLQTSTVVNNSAASGGDALSQRNWPTSTLENATLVGAKGDDIDAVRLRATTVDTTARVHSSVVAGGCDTAENGALAGFVSLGGNVEDGTSCGFDASSDQQSVDPRLALLQDVGARVALRVPLADSPAIDSGTCTANDGWLLPLLANAAIRPQDGPPTAESVGDASYDCDSGAAERQQVELAEGSGGPQAKTVSAGSTDVVMAQFELTNFAGEGLDGRTIRLQHSGSGDPSDVSRVAVYLDADANGKLDTDDPLVDSGTFNSSGFVRMDLSAASGSEPLLAKAGDSGDTARFFVVYDFANQLSMRDQAPQRGSTPLSAAYGWLGLALLPLGGPRRRKTVGAVLLSTAFMVSGCGGGGSGSSDTGSTGDGSNSADQTSNEAPTARVDGDRQVSPGTKVTLDATASTDPEGDPLDFQWQQTAGSPSVSLTNANSPRATFTTPSETGPLTFEVRVSDGNGNSDTVALTIDVETGTGGTVGNGEPTARTGADRQVSQGTSVTLDASASSDPDGDSLSFQWNQVAGSPSVSLTNASSPQATFTAPSQSTSLSFAVTVSDGNGNSDTATVTVDVAASDQAGQTATFEVVIDDPVVSGSIEAVRIRTTPLNGPTVTVEE